VWTITPGVGVALGVAVAGHVVARFEHLDAVSGVRQLARDDGT